MQLIAVSLIGIPASGKTTLAHKILKMSTMNTLNAGVIIISFDNYIKINFSELTEGEYKQQRETLMRKIDNFMQLLSENEQHRWSEILMSHELKVQYDIKLNYPTLVLLDDNMFYRSMRQRVRAICRSLQSEHFQIFIKSSLQEAKKRNQQRSTQVPDSIIDKMNDLIEPPTNPQAIIISSFIDDATLLEMLEDRINNPETIEVNQLKIQQRQSIIHEMDLITRKVLSMKIKSLSTKDNIAKYCETLNRKRKEFLDDLRSQNLDTADLDSLRAAFNCYLDE